MTTIQRFDTPSDRRRSQAHTSKTHPSKAPVVLAWMLTTLLGLAVAPNLARAQAAPSPELVLPPSSAMPYPQKVGDPVSAGLVGGVPGGNYRLAVLDENGVEVASRQQDADKSGEIPLAPVWSRTGVDGCDPGPGGGASPPPAPPYTFSDYAQAHAVLVGRVFTLVAIDMDTNALADSEPLVFLPNPDPIYYWSDSQGCRRGYLDLGEPLYLSLYNDHLESAPDSRVWVLERPENPGDWVVGYDFDDARGLAFAEGTETDLPASTTVYLVGTPEEVGSFLAVVRVEDPSLLTSERLACDRATINPILYGDPADIDENGNNESWSCPPCPPNQ